MRVPWGSPNKVLNEEVPSIENIRYGTQKTLKFETPFFKKNYKHQPEFKSSLVKNCVGRGKCGKP